MKTFLRKKSTGQAPYIINSFCQQLATGTYRFATGMCLFHSVSPFSCQLTHTSSFCLCHTKKDEMNLIVNADYQVIFSYAESTEII